MSHWRNLSHHDKLDKLYSDVEMLRHDVKVIECLLESILSKHRYGVRIRQRTPALSIWNESKGGFDMAITQGSTGTFSAALLDNGNPIPNPNPFSWSVDDTQASVSPSPDTLSAVVTIPAGDPATSVTITASTTAPDGSTASGTLVVQVQAEPQKFTVSVTQTA